MQDWCVGNLIWVMESHWKPLDLCSMGVTLVETGRSGNGTRDRKAQRYPGILGYSIGLDLATKNPK